VGGRLTPEEETAISSWRARAPLASATSWPGSSLGHANVLATQIYAEADRLQAMSVIGKVG